MSQQGDPAAYPSSNNPDEVREALESIELGKAIRVHYTQDHVEARSRSALQPEYDDIVRRGPKWFQGHTILGTKDYKMEELVQAIVDAEIVSHLTLTEEGEHD